MSKTESPEEGEIATIQSDDGTTIAVECSGSGSPLLLVHGSCTDRRYWEAESLRSALASQHTVYAMDRRGWGESEDADDVTIEREVEDILAVVDWIDAPTHLLGHSYGALLAFEAAGRTDSLQSLVLFEPPIFENPDELGLPVVVEELSTLIDGGQHERALKTFLEDVGSLTPEEVELVVEHPLYTEWAESFDNVLRRMNPLGTYEFDPSLGSDVTAPVFLLEGSESSEPLKEAVTIAREALGECHHVVFEGHGHEAHVTAPDTVTETVLEFTEEVE